jgi:SAM-dependent methyltransferase
VTDRTGWVPEGVDADLPSAARMYDYLLGGGHNFAADRELADKITVGIPAIRHIAILNRAFLRRAVLTLVVSGVRQFLDIGSGIPTAGNVHEIAQCLDPQCRVVYVDNEPVAVAHSKQVLAGNERATAILADMRDPRRVLAHPDTRRMLDFDAPIGLLMVTVFHYVADADGPNELIRQYRDALVPGSWLALTHLTTDHEADEEVSRLVALMKRSANPLYPRTRSAIAELFAGFELLDPGLVPTAEWRPDSDGDDAGVRDLLLAGVGIKR